jgi:ADP-heptose:LPS heptosyltransferase
VKSFSNPVRVALFRLLAVWLRGGQPAERKKLGIFKADGIGDFVLSSEAIRQLVAAHGANNVCLIVSEQVKGLAAALFPEVTILPIVPGHAALRDKIVNLGRLRSVATALAYDEVVCLRHYRTTYEQTILRSLHADRLVLLSNQSAVGVAATEHLDPKYFLRVSPAISAAPSGSDKVPREWSYHAAVLSASLGRDIAPQSMQPDWESRRKPRQDLASFMLISPLAGNRIRDLPPNLVVAAAEEAQADGLKHLILTGSKDQGEALHTYATTLVSALPHCRIETVHPEDLSELVDLVAAANVILTAETSTAHIATALDKSALVIIGGGHYGRFAPWRRSNKQVWLTNRLSCFDCNWRCPYSQPLCITNITVSCVKSALRAAQHDEVLNAQS